MLSMGPRLRRDDGLGLLAEFALALFTGRLAE
jgi:hypothetical protein